MPFEISADVGESVFDGIKVSVGIDVLVRVSVGADVSVKTDTLAICVVVDTGLTIGLLIHAAISVLKPVIIAAINITRTAGVNQAFLFFRGCGMCSILKLAIEAIISKYNVVIH